MSDFMRIRGTVSMLRPFCQNVVFVSALFMGSIVNFGTIAHAQDLKDLRPGAPPVGIDQRLGETVDMNLEFMDETGQPITLAEIAGDKPLMVMMVYYRCPGICSPLMSGVAEAVARLNPGAGDNFTLVSISFSPEEDYELAASKKVNYLAASNNRIPSRGWRFLTGTSENIDKITNQVGFNYIVAPEKPNEWTDYTHTGFVTVISPSGKISRYLLPSGATMSGMPGMQFLPMDFRLAAMESAAGKTGPVVAKAVQFCFSYDPQGRTYTFNYLRVAGVGIILLLGLFGTFLYVTTKSYRRRMGLDTVPAASANNSMSHEVTHHG